MQEVRIITSHPGLGNYKTNPGLKSIPKIPVHPESKLTDTFSERKNIPPHFYRGQNSQTEQICIYSV